MRTGPKHVHQRAYFVGVDNHALYFQLEQSGIEKRKGAEQMDLEAL
jgi:hypothetical protein